MEFVNPSNIRKAIRQSFRRACFVIGLLISCFSLPAAIPREAIAPGSANGRMIINIDVTDANDHWLAAGTTGPLAPDTPNDLSRLAPGNIGWFDYRLIVDRAGWYRLLVKASPHLSGSEFIFNPNIPARSVRLDNGRSIGNDQFEAGWVWLSLGPHILRAQNLSWTGFPQIKQVQLEAATDRTSAFRILPPEMTVFSKGTCAPLTFEAGGNATPFAIDVLFSLHGSSLGHQRVTVVPSPAPIRQSISVPCSTAGDIVADLRANSGSDVHARLGYSVFDTTPTEPTFHRGRLALEIDAASHPPDFQSGENSVVSSPAGNYRSSGSHGTTPFVRRGAPFNLPPRPDWFAYRVEGLIPNRPYILDVQYPDDEPRVFVTAFRDSHGRGYPISVGTETGVVWPLSNRMVHRTAVIWPSSSDARVILLNIHDGMKAAISHIRLYEADLVKTEPIAPQTRGRDVTFWYEEGDNFRDIVGEGHEPDAVFTPVDRFLAQARSSGASVVSPTVVVYNFAMYPSHFNITFSNQGADLTAAFMLGAERYGLKIVPQVYPRADELLWPPRDRRSLDKRLLLSADGQQHLLQSTGEMVRPPFYNPINADVRNWYVGMIGELADRYKSYPAFSGIDLRVSDWQNPALNNLVSLDWGYDAETVTRFFDETKLVPPAYLDLSTDAPRAARLRHDYLVTQRRAAWITWRCENIRDLYRDIVARIHSARPDLRLSVSVFADRAWTPEMMRELGIDLNLLRALDGVTIIDARLGHGAREAAPAWRRAQYSDFLSLEQLNALAGRDGYRPDVIAPMEYIEITARVAHASAVGLAPSAKEPRISAASEPPGRLALVRYATILGLTDAFMLGDGGNGYVFGGAAQAEFFREFRSLPRLPFERLRGVPDTIVLRQREGLFYVVNMIDLPISIRIHLVASLSARRTVSGEKIDATGDVLNLELAPYQMMAFQTEGHISGADASIEKAFEPSFLARATAAHRSMADACRGLFSGKPCSEARERLHRIEAEIAAGNYWTATKLMNDYN